MITRHAKREETQFKKRANIRIRYALMLKLVDLEFKRTMINILKTLMDKVDSMQNRWAM